MKEKNVITMNLKQSISLIMLLCCLTRTGIAEDWLTYQHDNRRSAVTSENLKLPLKQSWVYQPAQSPQPAWARPAKWDAYAEVKELKAMRNYDHAYYVIAVGDSIWFGSSVDDAVHCFDANTGKERWSYITEGAIRVTPTWHNHNVYFGSDDGCAYCLDAKTGKLIWKVKPAENDRLIPNNGKLISFWPCRTGVLVQNNKAYFAASLLPWKESWLCAVNAETGEFQGKGTYRQTLYKMTLEAPLLASATTLYALQGRSFPALFQIEDGKPKGVSGDGRQGGGVYAFLTEDDNFISGQGSLRGALVLHKNEASNELVILNGAQRIVTAGKYAYLQSAKEIAQLDQARYFSLQRQNVAMQEQQSKLKSKLRKLDKKKIAEIKKLTEQIETLKKEQKQVNQSLADCLKWQVPCSQSLSLILAGDLLFAGGENSVAAIDTTNGKQLWAAPVKGKALGLTVANKHLFVSSDTGAIYCFEVK